MFVPLLVVPVLLTLFFVFMMVITFKDTGGLFDITPIFKLFWVIPILIVWLVYFMIV